MTSTSKPAVALINMPFGPLLTPSLALSNIKSILIENEILCTVHYPNLRFAETIGFEEYHLIASGLPRAHDLLGEFIFTRALFREKSKQTSEYQAYIAKSFFGDRKKYLDETILYVLDVICNELDKYRDMADQFIDDTVALIASVDADIVGFTSAFQQNTASIAAAKSLKFRRPDLKIMFGGANCDGVMGAQLYDSFPFIDCIVRGEAENVIVDVVRRLSGAGVGNNIGDTLIRGAPSEKRGTNRVDLNRLPLPDFSDYFARASKLPLPEHPRLLFETSRGCWWGEKHHCKFCGLNSTTMSFHRKAPDLALAQLHLLAESYPGTTVCMTDNIIDYEYFRTFLPNLENSGLNLELFYEVKANLKKEQISLLRRTGVNRIQPGIESFSTPILELMDKGITGIQNVQLLKWCLEYGIVAEWNLLWGFPGENSSEYNKMSALIAKITHLRPPNAVGRLRLDRFSPYFNEADRYFTNVKPFESYFLVYPLDKEVVSRLAYFFEGNAVGEVVDDEHRVTLIKNIEEWRASSKIGKLFYIETNTGILIFDSRDAIQKDGVLYLLQPCESAVIKHCDAVVSIGRLFEELKHQFTNENILSAIDSLDERKLIYIEDAKILSVVVKMSPWYPGIDFLKSINPSVDFSNQFETSEQIAVL